MQTVEDVNEGSFVLVRALQLQQALESRPEPPAEHWWEVMERSEAKAHGPAYRPIAWFGELTPERIVKRCRRAIQRLEVEGLIVTWKKHGARLTHIKLTPEGERLAIELLAKHGDRASDRELPSRQVGDIT